MSSVSDYPGRSLGSRNRERTVNHEDVRLARGEAGHVEEVDVVLCERHHGVVPGGVDPSLANVRPREGRAVCGLQLRHVKEEKFALRQRVWKIMPRQHGQQRGSEGDEQNTFVSWSRMALKELGSNVPAVTDCVDHELAEAS